VRGLRIAAAALLLVAAAGCARVEPWVKPYERENLADPIMAWDRDPVSSSYMRHVYDSREGARGANGGAGGGCGCN
jgi:hypothetical protein